MLCAQHSRTHTRIAACDAAQTQLLTDVHTHLLYCDLVDVVTGAEVPHRACNDGALRGAHIKLPGLRRLAHQPDWAKRVVFESISSVGLHKALGVVFDVKLAFI